MSTTATKKPKLDPKYKNLEVVHEFDDGWRVVRITTPEDLKTFGAQMHHCAGHAPVWVCEEKIWYFFALADPQGAIHGTIHAKAATWMNKNHPRDGEVGTGLLKRCDSYDHQAVIDDYVDTFENRYYCNLPNRGNIPPGVDKEVWNAFVKSHKALCDNWKKNVAGVKTVGRRVKFDGKYLIILSAYGSYHSNSDAYTKRVGEWLNTLGKKKGA